MSTGMNFQTVPLAELASKGITSQADPPKPIVLVVDDEVVIADTLSAILARSGVATMTAYDAESALEIMLTIPPDLLLTDVVMPGMGGIELAIAIRRAIPDCKVMLFSGQAATVDLLAKACDAGHDFTTLQKPIHPTELLARISETLDCQTIDLCTEVASSSRVLVVEDSKPFRKIICSILGKRPELQIVGEVLDGLEAVQKAEELQPDLILLDIGLPTLGGIEAARRIHKLCPECKILFVSQESSANVVQEALGMGARGYVVKTDARRELLEAISAVLRGEQFVGRRFSAHAFIGASDAVMSQGLQTESAVAPLQGDMEIARPPRGRVLF